MLKKKRKMVDRKSGFPIGNPLFQSELFFLTFNYEKVHEKKYFPLKPIKRFQLSPWKLSIKSLKTFNQVPENFQSSPWKLSIKSLKPKLNF